VIVIHHKKIFPCKDTEKIRNALFSANSATLRENDFKIDKTLKNAANITHSRRVRRVFFLIHTTSNFSVNRKEAKDFSDSFLC
jgi:hypothetical protein